MGQREPTARADGPCTQEEGQMLTVVRDSGRAKENRDEARVAPTGGKSSEQDNSKCGEGARCLEGTRPGRLPACSGAGFR